MTRTGFLKKLVRAQLPALGSSSFSTGKIVKLTNCYTKSLLIMFFRVN